MQFRERALQTAQTEVISLVCVCTGMWPGPRCQQIYAPKSKGTRGSRPRLHSTTINGRAVEGRQARAAPFIPAQKVLGLGGK